MTPELQGLPLPKIELVVGAKKPFGGPAGRACRQTPIQ
jgi:hypothetical protein